MEVSVTKFQTNCAKFIEDVYTLHTEIVITKQGKPLAKLIYISETLSLAFIGSFTGIGETVSDLTEPFNDAWEVD